MNGFQSKPPRGNDRPTCKVPVSGPAVTASTTSDRTRGVPAALQNRPSAPTGQRFMSSPVHLTLLGVALALIVFIAGAARQAGSGNSKTRLPDASRLEQNRLEIEAMDVRQLSELRTRKTRFDKLPSAEQDRLRQLHQELESHPDREKLETIMLRYMDWLKSLDPINQAEVLDKQGDDRLREISRMRYQQSRQQAVLSPSDNVEFETWFRNLAESKPVEVSEAVDRIAIRRRGNFRPEKTASHEAMLRYVIASSERESAKILTAEAIQDLDSRLSSRGREILKEGDNVRAIRILVSNPVSEFELRRFFEEMLTPEQRAELDRLSPDEMKRKIRRMYIASQLGIASDRN